jgi:hypothetical protein
MGFWDNEFTFKNWPLKEYQPGELQFALCSLAANMVLLF